MVPPTRVALACGIGGNSGSRLLGSTAIESSVDSVVMPGFTGSMLPFASLSLLLGETMAEVDGWEACAQAALVNNATPNATIIGQNLIWSVSASFTGRLDADPRPEVVPIRA